MSEFKTGDYISDDSSGQSVRAVVLGKRDTGELELLWIPEHGCQVVPQAEVQSFTHSAVPDARWVEVFEKDGQEPIFAAYLPTFQAALGVLKWFNDQKAGHKVDIFTANEYEDELIDEFLDPASARGYS
jgi:hypothetical protein